MYDPWSALISLQPHHLASSDTPIADRASFVAIAAGAGVGAMEGYVATYRDHAAADVVDRARRPQTRA